MDKQRPIKITVDLVRKDGGDEIAHLFERVYNWYDTLHHTTETQDAIRKAAFRAAVMVRRQPTTIEDPFTVARNILRFCVVPETHITDVRRMTYIARAEAGEDVYAYGEPDSPTGIINVWDWDTRIPLFPLERWAWELEGSQPVMIDAHPSHDWHLHFKAHYTTAPTYTIGEQDLRDITITIARLPQEDLPKYGERVGRVCRMVEGYVNLYGDDPQKYDEHHF
jgi:hypothetical protein